MNFVVEAKFASSIVGRGLPYYYGKLNRNSLLVITTLLGQALGALSPEVIALAQKYAPQFRLTPNEKYFPSSVEHMLPHYKVYDNNGKQIANQPSPLTTSNLDTIVGKGASTWLTVSDTSASYLNGLNPASNKVPVYTFAVPKEGGIVDIFYWIFFPFNLGKKIIALGQVGNHIGDWERMTVRTRNGKSLLGSFSLIMTVLDDIKALQFRPTIMLTRAGMEPGKPNQLFAQAWSAEASGWSRTKLWSDVLKPSGEDRPLGYVAEGSHGVWPGPGSWVYQDIIIYQLKDETADGGPTWNAKDNVYPIEYLSDASYVGDQAWINYQGAWGNKGQTNCWWYPIVKTCPLSDGPGGPYRQDVLTASFVSNPTLQSKFSDMRGPLSQTLAPLANNSSMSSFKFRLDSSVPRLIELGSFKYVAVEQKCLDQPLANTTITSYNYGSSALAMGGGREYLVSIVLSSSIAITVLIHLKALGTSVSSQ
ncbi:vacuolar protein sorting-associated protein TDA6 [Ceratobasidium sp. AG-Ba]|nr:vacuolar protein sorting-associated protein TDA6 [Ceratobasidium sp. AG-Ba]